MVFLKPPEPPPPPPDQPPPDVIVTANPPPQGVPDGGAADGHPDRHSARQPEREAFDPKDFTGKGVEGGIATGVVGGTGPVHAGEVFLEAEVDDPVAADLRSRRRGIRRCCSRRASPGRWIVQYVVDTDGPRGAELVQGRSRAPTRRSRSRPGRRSARASSSPAKFKGQPVRVLVQQRISFKVGQ